MKSSEAKICDIHSEKAVKRLSKKPSVVCSRCGAKAHDPANLCAPVELFDVSS